MTSEIAIPRSRAMIGALTVLTVSTIGVSSPCSAAAHSGRESIRSSWPSNSIATAVTLLSAIWPAKLPSSSARRMNGARRGASSALTDAMLIALTIAPVARKSDICSATWSATFSWASVVAAPRWGVATTWSSPNRLKLSGGGSSA